MILKSSLHILLFLFYFSCSPNNFAQVEKKEIKYNRNSSQIYLEDSTDVFWTQYPDPFSNPTYTDRFVVSQAITFKCLLKGKVEIGILDIKSNSIIYKFTQPNNTEKKFNESFWIWIASSSADKSKFPKEYFQSLSNNTMSLVLLVDNKQKSILPLKLVVPIKMYCFINWSNYF